MKSASPITTMRWAPAPVVRSCARASAVVSPSGPADNPAAVSRIGVMVNGPSGSNRRAADPGRTTGVSGSSAGISKPASAASVVSAAKIRSSGKSSLGSVRRPSRWCGSGSGRDQPDRPDRTRPPDKTQTPVAAPRHCSTHGPCPLRKGPQPRMMHIEFQICGIFSLFWT